MSKAGKGDSVDAGAVGSQHPLPENIPHLSSPVTGSSNGLGTLLHPHLQHQHHPVMQAGSPVKESSFLNRETKPADVDADVANEEQQQQQQPPAGAASQGTADDKQDLPIRG